MKLSPEGEADFELDFQLVELQFSLSSLLLLFRERETRGGICNPKAQFFWNEMSTVWDTKTQKISKWNSLQVHIFGLKRLSSNSYIVQYGLWCITYWSQNWFEVHFQMLHFVMVCVQFMIIIASGQREWKRMSIQCPVPSLCSGYQYSTTVLCAMGWSPGGNFPISFSFYRHCSYLLVLENWKSSNRRVWNLWYFSIAFYLFCKSYKRLHQ